MCLSDVSAEEEEEDGGKGRGGRDGPDVSISVGPPPPPPLWLLTAPLFHYSDVFARCMLRDPARSVGREERGLRGEQVRRFPILVLCG